MELRAIIKEYCPQEKGFRFILRLPHYGHNLAHINQLFNQAQEDFKTIAGNLDSSQIQITHYGGQVYKGTFGIEFTLDVAPPEGYKRIEQVEYTL